MNNPSSNYLVPINSDKLRKMLAKTGKPLTTLSVELGRGKSYVNDALRLGRMNKYALKLLADMCGFAVVDVTPQPEPDEPHEDAGVKPDGVEAQLARIADALEVMLNVLALTKVERCTLLLQQMVCWGGCKRADFESKAHECGMEPEVQDIAIRTAGVKCRMNNGVEWLSKT